MVLGVLISVPTLGSDGVLGRFPILIHIDRLLFLERHDVARLLTSSETCSIFHRVIVLLEFIKVVFDLDVHAKVADFKLVAQFKGKDLAGTICSHPWRGRDYDFDVPCIAGDHVTTDAGTGFVHTAPGHALRNSS